MQAEPITKGDLVKLTKGLMTEAEAREKLEQIRWPDGVRCVFCDSDQIGRIQSKASTRKDGRPIPARDLYYCRACKKQFSVTKGTIFEDSKIPLTTWIAVAYRMCSSKRGVSAYQIMREYGLKYEAAWFMLHRIRWGMNDKNPSPLMGVVEADETYVGGKLRGHPEHRIKGQTMSGAVKAGFDKKTQVFGMVERGGRVRVFVVPTKGKRISQKQIQDTIVANVDVQATKLITDEHDYYHGISARLPHGIIRHKSEFVDGATHTQSIESFWSILKRGLIGTYYHVDSAYLGQYVDEFAFRHNTRRISDAERFRTLMGQISGRVDWYLGRNAKGAS
jgi:transposase-like protein